MIHRVRPVVCAACLLALALCLPALAQDKPQAAPEPAAKSGLTPSGTISFEYGQAAFILSGSGGKGTLRFGKKTYRIRLGGLGVGGIGAARISATGEVFNLTSLADFAGAYVQGRIGYAFGQGQGSLWLENARGVVLSLGGDGLVIEFAKKK